MLWPFSGLADSCCPTSEGGTSGQFWLTGEQVERHKPYFPRARGKPRGDARRVLGGILHNLRNGLRWQDAPTAYGPHKTLYNRFVR